MIINRKNRDTRSVGRTALSAAALSAVLALAACASDDAAPAAPADSTAAAEAGTAPAPAPQSTFNAGAPAPRFVVPPAADQSPPDVNTVPTTAPTPQSTAEERDAARKGLIADLANARHSDQGGRTLPVVVRPYVAAAAADLPAGPTAEETAPDEAITNRLDTPPPPRPAEADGPVKPAAGPAPANKVPTGN